MNPGESELPKRQFPAQIYTILIDAQQERVSLEHLGFSQNYLGTRLQCAPDWAAIELKIALLLLADARAVQK